ncbi:MAG: hypothetical protein QOE50_1473 [Sphingomonadales bacterium]|jgi:hypothetical protein|nr:hypothetical protein [Sphingomonadales bacterium]
MVSAVGAEQKARINFPLLVAVLLIPAVLGSSQTIFNDGDVSWHIATGQWILDHRAIPHIDPFSFTWFGKPWVPIEWLAELLYASAYRLAGYAGIAALVTGALMALHAVVYLNASRWVRAALLPIVAMDFVLIPMLLARPHVLTWPLLALWTLLMLRARERDRAPPLLAAALMIVWANLHGSFVFGLAIAAAFGLEALVDSADRPRAFRQWLVFGIACALACLINGNGLEGVLHPLRFTQLKMLPLIDEWKPSTPALTPYFFAVLAVTLGLFLWKRPRLPWVRWLLLAGLLGLALLQARHQTVLAIVAATILPQGFGRGAEPAPAGDRLSGRIALAAAALLVAVRAIMPLQPPDNEANPWKLIAAVPPELRSQHVLNGYSMGGPLILAGIRPYVDGRGDMYGDELVVGYARIAHGDGNAFAEAVRRWDIRWAMLPVESKLIPVIARSPEWRLVARDKVGVIYERVSAS